MGPAEFATPTAAFLFGLLGSAHCVVMCGGIAAALALRAPDPRYALLHSLGRVVGYTVAGAALAAIVAAGARVGVDTIGSDLAVAERVLRLAAAVLFIALGLRALLAAPPWRALEALASWVWRGALAPLAQRVGRAEGVLAAFALGVLWGWLPCAMSWTALLAAMLAGNAAHGALTMLAFGLGTLPVLGLGAYAVGRGTLPLQAPAWRRVGGGILVALGLWTGSMALISDAPAADPTTPMPGMHHGA